MKKPFFIALRESASANQKMTSSWAGGCEIHFHFITCAATTTYTATSEANYRIQQATVPPPYLQTARMVLHVWVDVEDELIDNVCKVDL